MLAEALEAAEETMVGFSEAVAEARADSGDEVGYPPAPAPEEVVDMLGVGTDLLLEPVLLGMELPLDPLEAPDEAAEEPAEEADEAVDVAEVPDEAEVPVLAEVDWEEDEEEAEALDDVLVAA